MPRQVVTIVKLGGAVASALLQRVKLLPAPSASDDGIGHPSIDRLVEHVLQHPDSTPILYWCAWIDHWLFGDDITGDSPLRASGREVRVVPAENMSTVISSVPTQFPEQEWLRARLTECAAAYAELELPTVTLVIRETLGACTTDSEFARAAASLPEWAAPLAVPDTGIRPAPLDR